VDAGSMCQRDWTPDRGTAKSLRPDAPAWCQWRAFRQATVANSKVTGGGAKEGNSKQLARECG